MHGVVQDGSVLLAIFTPSTSLCESVSCKTPGTGRVNGKVAQVTRLTGPTQNCMI
jgi:hypothetical protein